MSKLNKNNYLDIFSQVVYSRSSIRGFLSAAIEPDVLEDIFNIAQQAPSNCNTQPWLAHVVSGEILDQLRQKTSQAMMEGKLSMDFDYAGKYHDIYKVRQYDAAQRLYAAMGVEREDKAGRNEAFMRNFEFFGAPHAVFLFMNEQFGLREAMDVAMYAQTLMLALTAAGFASCPQTALGFHADIVREHLNIDANQKLLFGISFGIEDDSHCANRSKTERAPLSDSVKFYS